MSLHSLAQHPQRASANEPIRRTIPFDYQFYVRVYDPADERKSFVNQIISSTLTISIEAPFVATSIGYGFVPRVQQLGFGVQPGKTASPLQFTFGEMLTALSEKLGEGPKDFSSPIVKARAGSLVPKFPIGPQTAAAVLQGIRINPNVFNRFLLTAQDGDGLKPEEQGELFQTFVPPPDQIQFLYALYDNGTGRAFQSEPLLNVAGLGVSDGDRPFRCFATPILFSPRSTIQLDIIPQTNFHGELYVALHGYKVLGGEGTPTGHRIAESARRRRMHRR